MTAVPAQRPPYTRSFKNYIIDSKFQLKYTAMILLMALGVAGGLGGVLWKTSQDVVKQSQSVLEQSKLVSEQGEEVVSQNTKVSEIAKMNAAELVKLQYPDDKDLQEATASGFDKEAEVNNKKVSEQQDKIKKQLDATKAQQTALLDQQRKTLYAIVGALALFLVLIGILGIYFTHKVAGPIFMMRGLLRQVGEGKLTFHRKLRKGDELQEFFETFTVMVERIKARQAAEIEKLDAAIAVAKGEAASDGTIAALQDLRDAMQKANET
jgi:nitrogen fixation/metabolism regulation signal transduction histidine kinase